MNISVAMCTRDGERFLPAQLASIARQGRLPDEMVIFDDCSTDATVQIAKEFAAEASFPVTISVNADLLGVTRNFERAIASVTGDVVVLSDQDDVWLPHRLGVLEERFERKPDLALTFSDAFLINAQGRRTGDRLWSISGFTPRQQAHMRRDGFGRLTARSIVSGCTLALRTEHRDFLFPFPDERTGSQMRVLHDRWISLALAPAFAIGIIEEPLVEYRLHPAQVVGIPKLQIRKLVPSSLLRWRSAAVPTREHLDRLRANIGLLRLIADRVDQHVTGVARHAALTRISDAVDHLQARAAAHGSLVDRVPNVVRELGTGRYREFSLGIASATADLIRPGGRVSSGPAAAAPTDSAR